MRLAAIELDDTAVALARDGALVAESPGFALLDADGLTVGDDALARARLEPQMVHTCFWDRLSETPLRPAAAAGWNYADLARTHLKRLWESAGSRGDGLVLAVPGHFERHQLGLLLGVAEQLALPVRGMVDSALVARAARADAGLVVHVAVYLHRTLVTGIEVGESVRRVFAHSLEDHGLIGLYERWLRLISDEFVRTTRFDPLHYADSEQAIYERLPQWLTMLAARDSFNIQMAARDGANHAIRLTRPQLEGGARELSERLHALIRESCSNTPFALELAASAANVPGLAEGIRSLTRGRVVRLPPGAGALGALRRASWIVRSERGSTLTVSLPRDAFAASEGVEATQ